MEEYNEIVTNSVRKERNICTSGYTMSRIVVESNKMTPEQLSELHIIVMREFTRIMTTKNDEK